MTGPGKSPSWKGARIVAYWLSGTRPPNTSVSVPRLTPVRSVRTSTSSGPGSGSATGRISPRPGSATQNADAVAQPIDMHRLLNRNRRSLVRRKVAIPVDRGHGGEVARVQHRVHHRLGPANAITAVRALLTSVLAVLVVRDAPVGVIVALATVALVTDALDGRVARRTGTVSRFGARFDMETDAALLLVLSLYVARDLGLWVLAIGLARYVFLGRVGAPALVAGAGAAAPVVQGRRRCSRGWC